MSDIATQDSAQKADDDDHKGSKSGKSRRELPAGAVATLKAWLLSPEHFTHPYPTPQDQVLLMQKTGIDKKQLKNWFTNARRRIWKPMLKKQLEQGKIAQTGTGGVVAVAPGLLTSPPQNGSSVPVDASQVMQQNFQQAVQQQTNQPSQTSFDFSNNSYMQQQPQQAQQQQQTQQNQSNLQNLQLNSYYQQGQYNQQQTSSGLNAQNNSIGTANQSSASSNLNKTDSHAVLMELFARDQDLVRQAAEGAKHRPTAGNANSQGLNDGSNTSVIQQASNHGGLLGNQHPMSKSSSGISGTLSKLGNVPSLNSWPHFSSVSSLNNLGTMTGVKSITNMSGADLVSQGSLNKKGNLAEVKSIESMGRADSYAFLEVFFDSTNGSTPNQIQRGVKREREEDDNVGLSLDGDEGASPPTNTASNTVPNNNDSSVPAGSSSASVGGDTKDKEGLKRAYDDALAARGLISVSRSSEKLTDLALPAKMQRTISQEYIKSMNAGGSATFTNFSFNNNSVTLQGSTNPAPDASPPSSAFKSSNQPQHTTSHQNIQQQFQKENGSHTHTFVPISDPSVSSNVVKVPSTTKCAICGGINVDTQLRPCGHMFHGRCLKPTLQQAVGPPQCPIDNITMQSAVLAVPVEENPATNSNTTQYQPNHEIQTTQETKTSV